MASEIRKEMWGVTAEDNPAWEPSEHVRWAPAMPPAMLHGRHCPERSGKRRQPAANGVGGI